jgi:MFS family permease
MTRRNKTILGLMVPFFSLVLNLAMFSVAVPAIRDDFGLLADTASWVILAYTIPYILFMPFHGRMGDLLGPRKLIIVGITVYAAGTAICMSATGLGAIFAGRIIQAAGGASVNPLSLSILSREFDRGSRGRAMGTWNAAGPLTGAIGPIAAGVLIDALGWRTIFIPMLIAAGIAVVTLLLLVPADPPARREKRSIRGFDWPGMLLTATTLTGFVLFLSSRPVTGREPFTDWRLGLGFAVSAAVWIIWERRQKVPFVAVSLYGRPQFSIAAVCVSVRMLLLGALNFLVPLYAADVLGIPSAQTGIIITVHAAALLATMPFGGRLADVWNRRWAVTIGLSGQTLMMLLIAVLPGVSIVGLVVPLAVHGASAGLSLASLHHVALHEVPKGSTGIGAGTYSMTRFVGSLLGASVMGIVLEAALSSAETIHAAYQRSFLVAAILGLVGVVPALAIRRTPHRIARE